MYCLDGDTLQHERKKHHVTLLWLYAPVSLIGKTQQNKMLLYESLYIF